MAAPIFNSQNTHANKELEILLNQMSALLDGLANMVFEGGPTVDSLTVTGAETIGTTLAVTGVATFTAKSIHNGGLNTKQAVTNVNDTTPTDAELQTAFGGTAASLGRGFIGTIDDNDGNAIGYIVWTSDASFYFVKGTKAT